MAPALDTGSPSYRGRKGVESQTGLTSVELTPASLRSGALTWCTSNS